jgi:hypothetical protein
VKGEEEAADEDEDGVEDEEGVYRSVFRSNVDLADSGSLGIRRGYPVPPTPTPTPAPAPAPSTPSAPPKSFPSTGFTSHPLLSST